MTKKCKPENLGLASLSIHPKNVNIADLEQLLECPAPKRWSKYTTNPPSHEGYSSVFNGIDKRRSKTKGGNLRGKTVGEIQKWARAPELI